jgi:NADPH-dependent ferric siderophore reductase
MKQQIQATLKYKENMQVTFEMEIMVAVQSKQQTIVLAHGEAARITELAMANANVTTATVDAQINAYSMVAEAMGFQASSQDLLDYIWWESQQELGGKGKSSYMVGVNQAVYVAGSGAPAKSPLYS